MDFVTWVLTRLDSLMANAKKNAASDPPDVPKRNPEPVRPFGASDAQKNGNGSH